MADSGSPRHRRRSRDREDDSGRRDSARDRKRHHSQSPSEDRTEQRRRRSRSPRHRRHGRNDHDRSERRDHHRQRNEASDEDRHEHRRRKRSRSADGTRQRQRSHSRDRTNNSRRRDDEKQIVRSRHEERSRSRERYRHRKRSASRSPPARRAKGPLPSQQDAFSANRGNEVGEAIPPQEKQQPNYGTSGKLAAETNTVSIGGEAILLKYHEPPEARKPPSSQAWRMYEFKGDNVDPLSTTELSMRSCWLFGRETAVVDFLIEHPSCSKQHAVLQFRYIEKRSEFGDKIGGVKPYLLDLESANGTLVNGEKIPDRRYIELKSGDSIGFGESTRDYVVLLPPKDKAREA